MRETWSKLNIDQALSTAFHPRPMEKLNVLIKKSNSSSECSATTNKTNWANLLPFAEFAHNVRAHAATGRSPFQVWYGFQPEFLPPIDFSSQLPSVEERLKSLEQIRADVTAALNVAADEL